MEKKGLESQINILKETNMDLKVVQSELTEREHDLEQSAKEKQNQISLLEEEMKRLREQISDLKGQKMS